MSSSYQIKQVTQDEFTPISSQEKNYEDKILRNTRGRKVSLQLIKSTFTSNHKPNSKNRYKNINKPRQL